MEFNKFVPKGWGYESWIVNKPEYCGKLLFFKKGKQCSLHYHILKDETFYVHQGEVAMLWSDDEPTTQDSKDIHLQQTILKSGDSFHIPRKRIHRVVALQDSTVFEFSTQHFDSDSYRIEKGD